MERVEQVDFVEFYAQGEVLEDAEKIEHESVAGERAFFDLDLSALFVVPQQGRNVSEHFVAAAAVCENIVKRFIEAIPGVLEFLLERLIESFIGWSVS